MARSHRRAWIYVGREFLLAFVVAFLFFFFLFFLNQILVMAEEIFSKKVAFWDVVRLIAYSLPIVCAFSFPFGSLVGALMAVGRLSSDNELLAFGSLGVPPRQLVAPLLVIGVLFSLASFGMNDYLMPLGNMRFAELYRRILFSNPALELEPYSVKHYEKSWIVTGAVEGRADQGHPHHRRPVRGQQADHHGTPGAVGSERRSAGFRIPDPRQGLFRAQLPEGRRQVRLHRFRFDDLHDTC